MKKPNVPMNNAITTCRHRVDKKKYEDGWDRIWGKRKEMTEEEVETAFRILGEIVEIPDEDL